MTVPILSTPKTEHRIVRTLKRLQSLVSPQVAIGDPTGRHAEFKNMVEIRDIGIPGALYQHPEFEETFQRVIASGGLSINHSAQDGFRLVHSTSAGRANSAVLGHGFVSARQIVSAIGELAGKLTVRA